ncbi:MAG: glycosyltransferase family 39 protein [Candidatus Krumholzibacteriota bacterium]|nr:glycosyltransferase family 39 protein [Candidatus Krumholzibacteriota bacterium]
MSDRSEEKRKWTILAAIIIVAFILRFFRLGHQSFWVDEMMTIGSYSSPPAPVTYWKKLLWDMHGPLYSLIMHFWSLASTSESWLRAPSAVAGVLSVFFIYRWIRMIGSESAALAGALILALNPFHIYYSQELRFYSLLTMFLILSMIAFSRFTEKPGRKSAVVLGATLGLACLSHFMAIFLCAGILVYMLVTGKVKGEYLRFGSLAALIVFIFVSPWIYREIYFLRQINVVDISGLPEASKLRGKLTLNRWSYPYILYAFSVGFSFGPDLRTLRGASSGIELLKGYGFPLITVSVIFGVTVLRGLIESARRHLLQLFLSILAVSIGAVTIAAMLNIKVFNVRYLMSAFPVFIALTAFGIPESGRWRKIILSAVLLILVISVWNYHFDPLYERDDIRSGAEVITSREIEGDLILVPGFETIFRHYYSGSNEIVGFIPVDKGEKHTTALVSEYIKGHGRIWYFQCREWDVDPDRLVISALSSASYQTESWEFAGVRVFLFSHALAPDLNVSEPADRTGVYQPWLRYISNN